jgi:hypothetical protein
MRRTRTVIREREDRRVPAQIGFGWRATRLHVAGC